MGEVTVFTGICLSTPEGGGYPSQGTYPLAKVGTPGQARYPSQGRYPHGQGRYPPAKVGTPGQGRCPPIPSKVGTPPPPSQGRYPLPRTCYTVGDMLLTFTQEDFLVSSYINSFYIRVIEKTFQFPYLLIMLTKT